MNSKAISSIAEEPFIQKFVFAIIQNIRAKNFNYENKQIIHSDLVPKVSRKVMHASLGERRGAPINSTQSIMDKKEIIPKMATIKPKITRPPLPSSIPQKTTLIPQRVTPAPQIVPPAAPPGTQAGPSQGYGKITPLLNDPSISVIECQGVGKPIMVIRIGQKQLTRIVLSDKDIKEILDKVSDAVHIPLLEGVFRAAVDNFSINAVISEMIGSRFIIKKQATNVAPNMGTIK